MGKLLYLMTTSLDGYAADAKGKIDFAMPSEEVHSFVNEQLKNVGTILMGSKLYETMKVWDDIPEEGVGGIMDDPSQAMNDYAKLWNKANKIVYSKSLDSLDIKNAVIEREFDPQAVKEAVDAADKDYDIGGPHLAGEAIKANIIDEYHQIVVPKLLGDGLPWLPADVQLDLKFVSVHQFTNGFVHLKYAKV